MNKEVPIKKKCIDCLKDIDAKYDHCYTCLQTLLTLNVEYKETEGEEFISGFLEEAGIKYEKQVKLFELKFDSKKYRIADFKLTDYDLYIEYDGYWHLDKERYKEKKRIYKSNNIPCVYLYPENLGVLHFFIDKRIQKVLIEHKMKKQLRKYYFFKLIKGEKERLVYIFLVLLLIYFVSLAEEKPAVSTYIVLNALIMH